MHKIASRMPGSAGSAAPAARPVRSSSKTA
jgi:hypothetical protein